MKILLACVIVFSSASFARPGSVRSHGVATKEARPGPDEAPGSYPGITEEEKTLIRIARNQEFVVNGQKVRAMSAVVGEYSPAMCEEARAHAKFLAGKNFPNEDMYAMMPAQHGRQVSMLVAHYGSDGRSDRLLGKMLGEGKLKDRRSRAFFEIVGNSLPGLSEEEAAKNCLGGLHGSPNHGPTLRSARTVKYCLTMARSQNGRYYCVGLMTREGMQD